MITLLHLLSRRTPGWTFTMPQFTWMRWSAAWVRWTPSSERFSRLPRMGESSRVGGGSARFVFWLLNTLREGWLLTRPSPGRWQGRVGAGRAGRVSDGGRRIGPAGEGFHLRTDGRRLWWLLAVCAPVWDPEDGCWPTANSVPWSEPVTFPEDRQGDRAATDGRRGAERCVAGLRAPHGLWTCAARPDSLAPEHHAREGSDHHPAPSGHPPACWRRLRKRPLRGDTPRDGRQGQSCCAKRVPCHRWRTGWLSGRAIGVECDAWRRAHAG